MNNQPEPIKLLLLPLCLTLAMLLGHGCFTILHAGNPAGPDTLISGKVSGFDTVKYQGYRLHLTDFEVLKKTDDWVKLECTIVNSGRLDVDFSKKGTEHWVQINFDQTIFSNKLGGLRENIQQALYDENLRLAPGEVIRGKNLKVSTMPLPAPRKEPEPVISNSTPPAGREDAESPAVFSAKGGDEASVQETAVFTKEKAQCPDLLFANIRIAEQDDKWATIEYTIENKGEGDFLLFGGEGEHQEHLAIRAYISGVAVLSRGALPIGGQFVKTEPGEPKTLYPGGRYTGKLRLDIRKKTRYLKSLILSIESDQFHLECDKTNNTGAVILE